MTLIFLCCDPKVSSCDVSLMTLNFCVLTLKSCDPKVLCCDPSVVLLSFSVTVENKQITNSYVRTLTNNVSDFQELHRHHVLSAHFSFSIYD